MDLSRDLEESDDELETDSMPRSARILHKNSQRYQRNSSMLRTKNERQLLLLQSRTFRDFEALLVVLSAMEQWKGLADQNPTYVFTIVSESQVFANFGT